MQIVECPRDAMQGILEFIPTTIKIEYLNKLLKVGFHTLDFGSFVSPKAIPQLSDSKDVVRGINLGDSKTKLLAIIANQRGAEEALLHPEISYLGYPLSISETFQQRNTNRSIATALEDVFKIAEICNKKNKELITYISMGFGNPYGDLYSVAYLEQFTDVLSTLGVQTISISDTIGVAEPDQIKQVFSSLSTSYSQINFGVHLHSNPATAADKIAVAIATGCRRIDGAILGYGGCPMAEDELIGNINTRTILSELDKTGINTKLNIDAFNEAELYASKEVFGKYQ